MTASSNSSDRWTETLQCRPRLQPHVELRRQSHDGRWWYVMADRATGRHHRINAIAHRLF